MPGTRTTHGDRDDANGRSMPLPEILTKAKELSDQQQGSSEQLAHENPDAGGRGEEIASAKQPEPNLSATIYILKTFRSVR